MSKQLKKLIKESQKGNQLAQMQIYDNYCQAMFNVACRYLKNEEDAKDAMQDAFLKAFLKLGTFQWDKTFGVWLKRIVINQCLDILKKQRITFVYDHDIGEDIIDDEIDTNYEISKKQVLAAMNELPQKYELILQLYLIEGLDHVEISDLLKIPVKTSRSQLHRGKKIIKDLLKHKFYETES